MSEIDLSEKAIERATTIFHQADKDGNGTLDARELRHVIAKCFKKKDIDFNSNVLKKYTELQLNTHDVSGDGNVELDDFIVLYHKLMEDPELPIQLKRAATEDGEEIELGDTEQDYTPQPLNVINDGVQLSPEEYAESQRLFDQFDADNSGKIDREELTALIKEHMGPRVSNMIISRFVDANIDLGDQDDDGLIDREEFLIIFKKLYAEKGNWLNSRSN
eukprot:TRINITY_DN747_c0_g1_i1.p1 TRINITY_DN747_c0_g1~~TRINITY_DN747_c0_g1_i1.p1  ORF type:complete len:219 (-),score=58.96 TRINITY_DN747_c0_g1_i1:105-761(-)